MSLFFEMIIKVMLKQLISLNLR